MRSVLEDRRGAAWACENYLEVFQWGCSQSGRDEF